MEENEKNVQTKTDSGNYAETLPRVEYPHGWLLYDKIPTDLPEQEKATAALFEEKRKNPTIVRTRYAKQFNIMGVIVGLIMLAVALLGMFLPVFEIRYVEGGIITDSVSDTKTEGHLGKIKQSGLQFILAAYYDTSDKDVHRAEIQLEYAAALLQAQTAFAAWSAKNPNASSEKKQSVMEKLYTEKLSDINYVYYLYTSEKMKDAKYFIPGIMFIVIFFALYIISIIVGIFTAVRFLLLDNGKTSQDGLTVFIPLILFVSIKLFVPFCTVNIFYFVCVCALPVITRIACGYYHALLSGRLNKDLVTRSIFSPILTVFGIMFYGSDYIYVSSDVAGVTANVVMPYGVEVNIIDSVTKSPWAFGITLACGFLFMLICYTVQAVVAKMRYGSIKEYAKKNPEANFRGLSVYPMFTAFTALLTIILAIADAQGTAYTVTVGTYGYLAVALGLMAWLTGFAARWLWRKREQVMTASGISL